MKFRIKIFADGADLEEMIRAHDAGLVKGFTTNPTLMRKAGITDYEEFARSVLRKIAGLPISFEVFSDDIDEMARQAKTIAAWGKNVYVKIPVTNTKGETTAAIISSLSNQGIRLNITALLTLGQVRDVCAALDERTPAIVSLFAGRVADTGRDPVPMMKEAVQILRARPLAELLWASPREILNLVQADEAGCHIITMTSDLLNKIPLLGTELELLSLQTVKMFYDDAAASRYHL
jgi:transaldolase